MAGPTSVRSVAVELRSRFVPLALGRSCAAILSGRIYLDRRLVIFFPMSPCRSKGVCELEGAAMNQKTKAQLMEETLALKARLADLEAELAAWHGGDGAVPNASE